MKKGGSKAPAAPDPNVVANAQTQQNRNAALDSATLNRVDTYTPFGSQEYSQTGTDPRTGLPTYRQDIKLDPMVESLLRQQQGIQGRVGTATDAALSRLPSSPFSLSGLPGMSANYDDLRKTQTDALYGQQTAYLDPQFKQGEDALRSRLANQGIVEGSEAYTNAVGDFNRGKEFSYGQARNQAITGGGAEADRAYGQESDRRRMALSEMLTERGQPYSELAMLQGMQSPVDMPQFQGMSPVGVNAADIQGAYGQQYQGQIDAYNAKQQGKNNLLSGLFGLGSAAIFASDERVKEDIEPIGELNDGTNVYLFRYKGDETPQVGVMAQEVEKRDPGAIHERHGVKHVDYARVLARALEAA